MDENGGGKREKKPPYQFWIIAGLIYGQNHKRIDNHKEKVGDGAVSFLIDEFYTVTHKGEQHDKEHLH